MPYSTVQYTGNGLQTQFAVPFPFISRDHVFVTVDGVSKTFSWISDGLISIVPAPASGKLVTVQRNSSRNQRIVDFQDATVLTEQDLDLANTQAIYISQEAFDASDVASVTSEVTALRDAAGVYAANAAVSAADALQYKQNAASSADSASYFSGLAATNAASAEALNRVAKAGDTMTGGLNINLTGATAYGVASYLRFKDTAAGNPDFRTYGWYQWRPNFGPSAFAINGTGNYASCLSMGPEDDTGTTNGNAFINFYNHPDGSPNVIRLGPSIKLHGGYNGPTNGGLYWPEFYTDNAEFETLFISSQLVLGGLSGLLGTWGSGTVATQAWLQSNNGTFTSVPIVPPPSGTYTEIACYASNTDPDNSAVTRLRMSATEASLRADKTGTGTYLPLKFYTSGTEKAKVTATGALTAKTTGYYAVTNQSTSTTTHTIDFTASQYYKLTMGHNIATLTLTAPEGPCVVQLEIVQDATGSRTMAWPASLKWPASYLTADKTISTTANARDLLVLRWNGTDYVANLLKGIA